jgi:succinoglycan biosynthesis protein ExoA
MENPALVAPRNLPDNRFDTSMKTNKLPFVTVIMPVRNEANFIRQSLDAVMSQDYPAHLMEVIVADGMSTDETRSIIGSLQQKYANLQLIDNPGRIAPTGLNAAIAQARGEIIVRVDGHCEIEADYVRCCVQHLMSGSADGVGGPLDTIGETPMARVIALAMSSPFGVGGSAFRTVRDRTMLTDTVAFPAYTREILERAGSFDEELVRNQDDEYNYRLRKLGARILLAADVRCRYYSRGSLRALYRQYFQYGYWKVRVMQKHPRQMRPRQFIPAVFVGALLVSLLLGLLFSAGKWLFLLVAGSYLLANLAASVLTARKDFAALPILPLTFAILHLSYGFGFLKGLIKFRSRWSNHHNPSNGSNSSGAKRAEYEQA